jgi:hypothetical protein
MSDEARVLSQLAHLEIFKKQVETFIDLKGWVANQQYLIDPAMTSKSFVLRAHDSNGLKAALANDCNRMAMAAIESISGFQPEKIFPKSSGWATIRAYYASFFD